MYKNTMLKKVLTWMTLLGMGGVSFQLSGCDQTIRTGILGGLNSATTTLVTALTDALFLSLDNAGQDDDLTGGLTDGGGG